MLVRMKVGISGPLYTLDPGDQFHFDDDEAGRLIAAGFAEEVEESASDNDASPAPARKPKKKAS